MFILSSAAYFRPIELEAIIIAQMLFISTILSKANETWAGCWCRNTRVISHAENSTSKTCFLISSLNKFLFIQKSFLCPLLYSNTSNERNEIWCLRYVSHINTMHRCCDIISCCSESNGFVSCCQSFMK